MVRSFPLSPFDEAAATATAFWRIHVTLLNGGTLRAFPRETNDPAASSGVTRLLTAVLAATARGFVLHTHDLLLRGAVLVPSRRYFKASRFRLFMTGVFRFVFLEFELHLEFSHFRFFLFNLF